MNLGQILQKTATDRYGERDTRYKALHEEMGHSLKGAENPRGTPFILRSVPRGSRVLEFGPASGYMTRYLKEELGCEVTIVELDPDCAASASVYAERCFIGNIDDHAWDEWLGDDRFDIITFCDVLEHLREPWDILKRAASHLREDGSILCSIPNVAHHTVIAHLLENEFEYFSCGLLDITHVRFFTSRSLNDLFEYCGLGVAAEGNTIMPEARQNAAWPWITEVKTPALLAFQEKLSKRPPYQIFQYVAELKHSFWMSEHHMEKLDLCRDEYLVNETDLPKGDILLEMERKLEDMHLQKEDLLQKLDDSVQKLDDSVQKREALVREKEIDQERLASVEGALKKQADYLEGVLSSRGIKVWNRCLKVVSLFLILPAWRRALRKKYTVK